jgi:hypothetical protein
MAEELLCVIPTARSSSGTFWGAHHFSIANTGATVRLKDTPEYPDSLPASRSIPLDKVSGLNKHF